MDRTVYKIGQITPGYEWVKPFLESRIKGVTGKTRMLAIQDNSDHPDVIAFIDAIDAWFASNGRTVMDAKLCEMEGKPTALIFYR